MKFVYLCIKQQVCQFYLRKKNIDARLSMNRYITIASIHKLSQDF